MNKEFIDVIKNVISLVDNLDTFSIDCGCEDYCECYYDSIGVSDDSLGALKDAVFKLKKFIK